MSYKTMMVGVSPTQRDKVLRAMKSNTPTKIRLNKKNLEGGAYPLAVTKMQKKRMKKALMSGKGLDVPLNSRQLKESMRMSEMMGSGWFKDIVGAISKIAEPIAKNTLKTFVGEDASNQIVDTIGKFGSKAVDSIDKSLTKKKNKKGGAMYPFGSGAMYPFGSGAMYPFGSGCDSDEEICPCQQCSCDGSGFIQNNMQMQKKNMKMQKRQQPRIKGLRGSGQPELYGLQSGPQGLY